MLWLSIAAILDFDNFDDTYFFLAYFILFVILKNMWFV